MATQRKSYAKWSKTASDGVGFVTYSDGTTDRFDLTKLTRDVRDFIEWYGAKQSLSDKVANADTIAAFKAGVRAKWDMFMAGETSAERTGPTRLLILAIARVKGVSEQRARDAVAKADKEQIAAWRKLTKIKLAMNDIEREELERATPDETADEELPEFDDE